MAKLSIKTPKGWVNLKSTYDLVKEHGYTGSEEQFASILKTLISEASPSNVPSLIRLYTGGVDGAVTHLNPNLDSSNLHEILAECKQPTVIKCVLCNSVIFSSGKFFDLLLDNDYVPVKCLEVSNLVSETWLDISNVYTDYGFESGDIIELEICNSEDNKYAHLLTTPYRIMETSSF